MKKIKENILITGCAGFIGFHLCKSLSNKNYNLYGIDNLNKYYDVNLKKDRLKSIKKVNKKFFFTKIDISNFSSLEKLFKKYKFNIVINLAAQAGVRYSIKNPGPYYDSNIKGFYNILYLSNLYKVSHLLFASTSSVYGDTKTFPTNEFQSTDRPLSFYAASKKCNEIMAYSFSNIYNLPVTGMRFFTVYGPMGRPDMSLFKFTKLISENKKIDLYNKGNHIRDFTYIDDVVNSIILLIKNKSRKKIPYQILNICSSNPVKLKQFIKEIENNLCISSKVNKLPKQLGDVHKTFGDNGLLIKTTNYLPKTNIQLGIKKFIKWYRDYFK